MALALADGQARTVHLGSIAAAVVLLLVALLALGGPDQGGARLAVIVLLLALLGVQVWLVAQAGRSPSAAPAEAWSGPVEPAQEEPRMVIRCKQCGEVFPVVDTGARPLVAACPHCGKSGTIKVKAHGQP